MAVSMARSDEERLILQGVSSSPSGGVCVHWCRCVSFSFIEKPVLY